MSYLLTYFLTYIHILYLLIIITDLPLIAPTLTDSMSSIASSTSFNVSWTINNTNYDIIVILTNLRTEEVYNITVTEYTVNMTICNVTEGLNGIDNYNVSVATINACGMMMSDTITVYGKSYTRMYVRTYVAMYFIDLNNMNVCISRSTCVNAGWHNGYTYVVKC